MLKNYRRLLSNSSYIGLLTAQTVSVAGDALFDLAIAWMVFVHTQSFFMSAIVLVVQFTGPVIIGPFAGGLIDKWNERNILISFNLLSTFIVALISVYVSIFHTIPIWLAYIAVFLLNSFGAILGASRFAILPQIVEKKDLSTSSGVLSSFNGGASIGGKAIAGFVMSAFSLAWIFIFDSLSFAIAAFCIYLGMKNFNMAINKTKSNSTTKTGYLVNLRNGFKTLIKEPSLRSPFLVCILGNFGTFTNALWPGFVAAELHGTAGNLGFILALGVVGSIIGGVIVGLLETRFGVGLVTIVGMAITGICWILIYFTSSILIAGLLSFFGDLGLVLAGSSVIALIQATVPIEHRGTIGGLLRSLSAIGIPLVTAIAGWSADKWGSPILFIVAGLWYLLVGGVILKNRDLRNSKVSTAKQIVTSLEN